MAHDHHEGVRSVGPCPTCDVGPFTRNAYWMGKLLVARDFVDEQRYVTEKLRHHNRTLHGTGVACGLRVVQHEKETCRDRFVCVTPGAAVDCCGHDIVVRERDCLDLWAVPAIAALRDKAAAGADPGAQTLRICIRYRECETEPVPVLYDDCGCADDRCAPNRILESYALDVLVGDPLPPAPGGAKPANCGDLWWKALDDCAHCDTPDCLVLATIKGWRVGDRIVDALAAPPVAQTVAIDNREGRTLLPSTQLIVEVIECMLPAPGPGPSPGPGPGPGPGGPPPTPAVVFTHIQSVNWGHGRAASRSQRDRIRRDGLLVAFDSPDVVFEDLHPQSVIVQTRRRDDQTRLVCWCDVAGDVIPVNFATLGDVRSAFTAAAANTLVNGVRFAAELPPGEYRVVLKGDYVRGLGKRAVDADHLPPWLGAKNYLTGDGTEGGLFESWLVLE